MRAREKDKNGLRYGFERRLLREGGEAWLYQVEQLMSRKLKIFRFVYCWQALYTSNTETYVSRLKMDRTAILFKLYCLDSHPHLYCHIPGDTCPSGYKHWLK